SPFPPSTPHPGCGTIHLSLLPPTTPTITHLTYRYPLKLIAPAAVPNAHDLAIPTIYLLSYGGGLVSGDAITLTTALGPGTRLILLTQGSTKVFGSKSGGVGTEGRAGAGAGAGDGDGDGSGAQTTRQESAFVLGRGAALCWVPDPVQPFGRSLFEQRQLYELQDGVGQEASLCVLDWVSEGRGARGEKWAFWRFRSANEVWAGVQGGKKRTKLLLRDNLVLDEREVGGEGGVKARMDGLGVFGTLILRGEVFEVLGRFFMAEFAQMPRIGGRKWDEVDGLSGGVEELSEVEAWRNERLKRETVDGLLWTAAAIRGFVLVKFGAREVEGAKRWLLSMFKAEGSIEREFGERALLCLK
ncbi:UreD-domain-containing protein, partial [Saccharata proteae CBS 121410]